MPMDDLQRAGLAHLGPRPTSAARRDLATTLRQLADEQERLADAEERQARKPAAERVTFHTGKRGRGLFYLIGSPRRIDVVARGRSIALVATDQGQYAVIAPKNHMPHFIADGARDIISLEDGRYAAEMHGTTLVLGEAL